MLVENEMFKKENESVKLVYIHLKNIKDTCKHSGIFFKVKIFYLRTKLLYEEINIQMILQNILKDVF